jgi:hypothetical protein
MTDLNCQVIIGTLYYTISNYKFVLTQKTNEVGTPAVVEMKTTAWIPSELSVIDKVPSLSSLHHPLAFGHKIRGMNRM